MPFQQSISQGELQKRHLSEEFAKQAENNRLQETFHHVPKDYVLVLLLCGK